MEGSILLVAAAVLGFSYFARGRFKCGALEGWRVVEAGPDFIHYEEVGEDGKWYRVKIYAEQICSGRVERIIDFTSIDVSEWNRQSDYGEVIERVKSEFPPPRYQYIVSWGGYGWPGVSFPDMPEHVDDVEGWNRYWSGICGTPWAAIKGQSFDPTVRRVLKRARGKGLRNIFYPGCGVSFEPDAFAALGFSVTALDVSSVVIEFGAKRVPTEEDLSLLMAPVERRPGGSIRHVVGDMMDPTVCAGPFDMIICRATVQWFYADGRLDAALAALTARLSPTGLLVITSHFGIMQMEIIRGLRAWLSAHGFAVIEKPKPTPAELDEIPPGRMAWCYFSTG